MGDRWSFLQLAASNRQKFIETWSPPHLHIKMKTFALVATIAVAIPAVICFIPSGISIGAGSSLPVISLGSASLAGSGLASEVWPPAPPLPSVLEVLPLLPVPVLWLPELWVVVLPAVARDLLNLMNRLVRS